MSQPIKKIVRVINRAPGKKIERPAPRVIERPAKQAPPPQALTKGGKCYTVGLVSLWSMGGYIQAVSEQVMTSAASLDELRAKVEAALIKPKTIHHAFAHDGSNSDPLVLISPTKKHPVADDMFTRAVQWHKAFGIARREAKRGKG